MNLKNLTKIKGDASFRKFFRKKDSDRSSVIVYAKKEKLKNLIIYDSINKILIKNKILAPTLYNENYNQHYIEIQDFGDETILKILRKKNNNLFDYFKKAIRLLNIIKVVNNFFLFIKYILYTKVVILFYYHNYAIYKLL